MQTIFLKCIYHKLSDSLEKSITEIIFHYVATQFPSVENGLRWEWKGQQRREEMEGTVEWVGVGRRMERELKRGRKGGEIREEQGEKQKVQPFRNLSTIPSQ